MLDIRCAGCGRHVMLPTNRIEAVVNTVSGVVVAFRCWCGARGAERF